jgi:predicted ATP-binding protein involved in virulence
MKVPVYFLQVEFDNVRSFDKTQILDLSDGKGNWKRWTVILGDNGLGKTSILQAIASLEIFKRYDNDGKYSYSLRGGISVARNSRGNNLIIRAKVTQNFVASGPHTSSDLEVIGYTENNSSGWSYQGKYYQSKDRDNYVMSIYSYGANRVMGNSLLADSPNEDNSETLFDETKKLINAEEWLLQLDYAASKESNIKSFAENKRNQVRQTLIDLLPDVTNIRFTTPNKTNLKSSIEFQTSFGWLGLNELSLGYRTMVAWMIDLAARMFRRNPDSDNPLAEPAIVLIDEIDLHLHPKWQRNIFEYLSEKFPNCQFIVTAHSPLVVQSAPQEVNLVVLRKEGHKVIIDNDINNVRNWRLDQILASDLFGIESARNVDLEKTLFERTALLKQEKLTTKDKERLNELNLIVHNLPTANNSDDIEAMEIIRKAADFIKNKRG